ncbi:MAG: ABC transporter permease [Vicinamibacterales bacterium]
MGHLVGDIRFAARLLVRQPVVTAVAVLSLALGIGANTVIFSLVNEVFLRALPVEAPDRLVAFFTVVPQQGSGAFGANTPTSRMNFEDYRREARVFSGLAAATFGQFNVAGGQGEPEQVGGQIVSANYFDTIRPPMALGRGFAAERDDTPGAAPVAVLSYGFWQRRFGGAPDIVGRTLSVNGHQLTVIGVTARAYTGLGVFGAPAITVPFSMQKELTTGFIAENWDSRRALLFQVTGRLGDGVTVEQAKSAVRAISARLAEEYPTDNEGRSATVVPLAETTVSPVPAQQRAAATAGVLLMVVVGLVLLIACANVANLLLARAAARRHEIAVRLSVGAGRGALVRQLLVESLLLGLLGGAVGLVVAYWTRLGLLALRPPFLPPDALTLPIDGRVLAFTAVAAVVTGVLFGLAPALQFTRPDLVGELKDRSSQPAGRGWFTLRHALVVGQMALSSVALVGAGLFVRSLANAQQIDPGFDARSLATLSFDLAARGMAPEAAYDRQREVLERVASAPGVEQAALTNAVPLTFGGFARTVFLDGQDMRDRAAGRFVQIALISPSYFDTTGIPVTSGRAFTGADRQGTPAVAVVNETMAKQFWPDESPIGKRFFFFGQDAPVEVVGVARDAKVNFIGEDPLAFAYQPLAQQPQTQISLIVRSAAPEAALGAVRAVVQGMEPTMPLTGVLTFGGVLDQGLWAARMGALLVGVFGALALLLAAIGVYGVMAYLVSQRTREIGVRLALGATTDRVRRMVLGHGLVLAAVGLALGIGGAALVARPLSALLYGVSPFDLATFAAVPVVLLATVVVAVAVPARRAARVDASEALRSA